jgi:hypothetical protein
MSQPVLPDAWDAWTPGGVPAQADMPMASIIIKPRLIKVPLAAVVIAIFLQLPVIETAILQIFQAVMPISYSNLDNVSLRNQSESRVPEVDRSRRFTGLLRVFLKDGGIGGKRLRFSRQTTI